MLVKITDFPDDQIDNLKLATGQNTASKAVFFASTQFVQLSEENSNLAFTCQELEEEVKRLKQVIFGARSAAALLIEQVSQPDLFQVEG